MQMGFDASAAGFDLSLQTEKRVKIFSQILAKKRSFRITLFGSRRLLRLCGRCACSVHWNSLSVTLTAGSMLHAQMRG